MKILLIFPVPFFSFFFLFLIKEDKVPLHSRWMYNQKISHLAARQRFNELFCARLKCFPFWMRMKSSLQDIKLLAKRERDCPSLIQSRIPWLYILNFEDEKLIIGSISLGNVLILLYYPLHQKFPLVSFRYQLYFDIKEWNSFWHIQATTRNYPKYSRSTTLFACDTCPQT